MSQVLPCVQTLYNISCPVFVSASFAMTPVCKQHPKTITIVEENREGSPQILHLFVCLVCWRTFACCAHVFIAMCESAGNPQAFLERLLSSCSSTRDLLFYVCVPVAIGNKSSLSYL